MEWDLFDKDGIEPSDIRQGKIANSYFLAGLAGMAEMQQLTTGAKCEDKKDAARLKDLKDEADDYLKDNFLVKNKNEAGCYPIVMTINGERIVVVVDEWFPFYVDHNGIE